MPNLNLLSRPLQKLIIAALLVLQSCSKEETDQGGDHLPELRTFENVSFSNFAVPESKVRSQEVSSKALRRFVHVAEHVTVCLESELMKGFKNSVTAAVLEERPDELDDAEALVLASLQQGLRRSELDSEKFGLEGLLDQMILKVGSVFAERKPFSKRLEIELVLVDSKLPSGQKPNSKKKQSCDLVIDSSSQEAFPMNDSAAAALYPSLFYKNQLRNSSGQVNGVPIAYLSTEKATTLDALFIELQRLIAFYLGLNEPAERLSPLNREGSDAFNWPVLRYLKQGYITPETLSLAAYIGILEDTFGATDLSASQYYLDEFGGTEPQSDPLFETMSYGIAAKRWKTATPGGYYSVTAWQGALRTCVVDLSGKDFTAKQFDAFLAGYALKQSMGQGRADVGVEPTVSLADAARSNIFVAMSSLGLSLEGFGTGLERASSVCQLVVQLRNDNQFPFKGRALNGRFALEGKIKDSSGSIVPVPVIYLNASSLSFLAQEATRSGDELNSESKSLDSVFKHEFAHFLGLNHSRSAISLLYPGGFNTIWDLQADDGETLRDYIQFQSAKQLHLQH